MTINVSSLMRFQNAFVRKILAPYSHAQNIRRIIMFRVISRMSVDIGDVKRPSYNIDLLLILAPCGLHSRWGFGGQKQAIKTGANYYLNYNPI